MAGECSCTCASSITFMIISSTSSPFYLNDPDRTMQAAWIQPTSPAPACPSPEILTLQWREPSVSSTWYVWSSGSSPIDYSGGAATGSIAPWPAYLGILNWHFNRAGTFQIRTRRQCCTAYVYSSAVQVTAVAVGSYMLHERASVLL